MRKAKRPGPTSVTDKLSSLIYAVIVLGCYLRLYVSVGLIGFQDEYHWVGSAALSALGGTPFINDLNIQQLCGLTYEPFVWLYMKLFGSAGVLLFVRHLYFALALATSRVLFLFVRDKTSRTTALVAASLPLVTAFWGQPSLGYNAIGGLGFVIGSVLTLQGIDQKRRPKLLLGALSFALVLSAYPTMVGGVAVFWILTLATATILRKAVWREFAISASLTSAVVLSFVLLLIWRSSLDQLQLAYTFSTSQSSMGSFTKKFAYGFNLYLGFLPPWYVLVPGFLGWFYAWRKHGVSWIWFATPLCLWIALQEPPEPGPTYPAIYFTLAWSGLPLLGVALKDLKTNWKEVVLFSACLISVLFPWWSSALTFYVTFITSTYCCAVLLIWDQKRSRSVWIALLAFVIPLTVFSRKIVLYQFDDGSWQQEWMTEGPYAGIFTSAERADFLRNLARDLESHRGEAGSIFFYDEFPLGYLMTPLRPATPTIFTHGLRESFGVRPYYNQYYSVPGNRPDLIVRFNYFMMNGQKQSVHPDQYQPYEDVFWRFPETSGVYQLVLERDQYSIFKKRPAP